MEVKDVIVRYSVVRLGGNDMTHSRLLIATLAFPLALFGFSSASAQTNDHAQAVTEFKDLLGKMKALENRLLVVSAEDKAAFADFLKQPGTGLIRLLPREKYEMKLPISGGGAYYSFTRLTHEYGRGSDIGFEQGKFKSGFAGFDIGFFISLGDLPLEAITPENAEVNALAEYQAPPTEAEIRAQQRQTHQGIKLGEFTATSRLPAKVGTTYALRSLDFDVSDVLVAFRVIRQDQDGSVVLLWKTLKKFPTPTAILENRSQ
jgi:hypothetical protein